MHALHGTGEICLVCLHPIFGLGLTLTQATLTTHAHVDCEAAARRLLGTWAGAGRRVHALAEQEEIG